MLTPEQKTFLLEADTPAILKSRVIHLRRRGKTIREIAEVINRSPSTVAYWSQGAMIGVVTPPKVKTVVKRRYVEPAPHVVKYMQDRAPAARRTNRHSEYWSNDAILSRELNTVLYNSHYKTLVPLTILASICGISTAAVSQRLRGPRVGD